MPLDKSRMTCDTLTMIYNAATGIPANLANRVAALGNAKLRLIWSAHAKHAAVTDRYGVLPVAAYAKVFSWTDNWTLVEVESTATEIVSKFVIRRVIDAARSIVLVVTGEGVVKTCWVNLNSDNHATLNTDKLTIVK